MPKKHLEFYSETFEKEVVKVWLDRKELYQAEKYLLKKYLIEKKANICDVGTGSGRIAFYLEEAGFENIWGFDLSERMIAEARKTALASQSSIDFTRADACDLNMYPDGHFQYLLYLQQILSMVPSNRLGEALKEAHRIGRSDSTYIFSFMDWEARKYNPVLSLVVNTIRFFTFQKLSWFFLPELRFNGRFNRSLFRRDQHPIWWPKMELVKKMIEDTGFNIVATYKQKDISGGSKDFAFYLICSKGSVVHKDKL